MEGLKAGAGGSRRGSRHESYHFTDPNELFRQFFGSTSIFDIMDEMMGARSHGGASRRNSNRRPDPFDPFVNGLIFFEPIYNFRVGWWEAFPTILFSTTLLAHLSAEVIKQCQCHHSGIFGSFVRLGVIFLRGPFGNSNFGGIGIGGMNMMSSMSSSGGGGGGFRSVSQSTTYINGKQVTTKTTQEGNRTTVERIENGQVVSKKVNGVEQLQAIHDGGHHSSRRSVTSHRR